MKAAIDETKKWPSFCRIELEVVPWNKPAIHLYESLGFVREGVKRKAANYGGKPTDSALMALVW
jgi:putative acetyltransferase